VPKLIQQSTGNTNPQLQLTPERETEPDPKVTDQTDQNRSGQKRQPVERLIKAMMAEMSCMMTQDIEGKIFCLQAMYPIPETE
jgi:hypothetical protein